MPAATDPDPRTASAPSGLGARSLACLAVLAVLYTMYFAANLLMPIAAALLLYLMLAPVVGWFGRLGLPKLVSAIIVTTVLISSTAWGILRLSEPGAQWLRDAPTSMAEFRAKVRSRPNPIAEVRTASEAVEQAVAEFTGANGNGRDAAQEIAIREPGALETVLARLPMMAASAIITYVLTLFLLVYGDNFQRRIVGLGGSFARRRRLVTMIRQVERDIARYLGTITLVNIGLGAVVTGVMHWIGLPNPLLWGVVACVLNFAPYVGAAITTITLALAGISAFDTVGAMFAPALAFLAITTLEGQFITPILLGHRLRLSPLIVFLSVLLFGWLWGLVGALLAVPLVASTRIVLSNGPEPSAVARLLSR